MHYPETPGEKHFISNGLPFKSYQCFNNFAGEILILGLMKNPSPVDSRETRGENGNTVSQPYTRYIRTAGKEKGELRALKKLIFKIVYARFSADPSSGRR